VFACVCVSVFVMYMARPIIYVGLCLCTCVLDARLGDGRQVWRQQQYTMAPPPAHPLKPPNQPPNHPLTFADGPEIDRFLIGFATVLGFYGHQPSEVFIASDLVLPTFRCSIV